MRSNWTPWDLLKSRPTILPPHQQGIVAIHSPDAYIEKMLVNRLPHKSHLTVLVGSDMTAEWVENNLLTTDMFSAGDSYLILNSEDIPANVKDLLFGNQVAITDRLVVFLFSKSGVFFEKWSKNGDAEFIKVEQAKFWEVKKLLDLLCQELKISIPYDVSNFLLESINTDDSGELYHFLGLLRLHAMIGVLPSIEIAKELLNSSKLDQFKLATLFCQKRYAQFWDILVTGQYTFDQLRGFFLFMSSHLFKVYDPSYLRAKSKPSKYDQEILAFNKKWKSDELQVQIELFAKLEQKCKARDDQVYQLMRLSFLKIQ